MQVVLLIILIIVVLLYVKKKKQPPSSVDSITPPEQPTVKYCSDCKRVYSTESVYCEECGLPLTEIMEKDLPRELDNTITKSDA